jgi:hypothetical protein
MSNNPFGTWPGTLKQSSGGDTVSAPAPPAQSSTGAESSNPASEPPPPAYQRYDETITSHYTPPPIPPRQTPPVPAMPAHYPPYNSYTPPLNYHPPRMIHHGAANKLAPTPPFIYPPGYLCRKCRNTGFKTYNGQPCGTCARSFARPQRQNVGYLPHGVQVLPMANAPVLPAGDPRLGGILCGNCKGRGWVDGFFDTSNCQV